MKHIVIKIVILICFVVSNPLISAKRKSHATSKKSTQSSPRNSSNKKKNDQSHVSQKAENIAEEKKYFFEKPLYFVTVADEEHFPWLNILIRSIKKYNPSHEMRILVFDLGLHEDQIKQLEEDPIIAVSTLEQTNPYITQKFVVRSNGRLARGWYSWKPVAIKQAFEYFPYFLYIDAGKRITGPSDDIFHLIEEQGYFLLDVEHEIAPMTTNTAREYFNIPKDCPFLKQNGLEAGIQGLSLKVYDEYVLPMYHLSYNIHLFEDDGTAPWGFGGARHDQTLFSIRARLLGYHLQKGNQPFPLGHKNGYLFKRGHYFDFKNFSDNPLAQECCLI